MLVFSNTNWAATHVELAGSIGVAMTIKHAPMVGHFVCQCGLHLKFGEQQGSRKIKLLKDQVNWGEGHKIGTCPNCGIRHEVVPMTKAQ